MSLATALARDGIRPASFLPTIKCSDCAQEIEIAEMGDHVCAGAAPAPPPPPPFSRGHAQNMSNPFVLRRFNTYDEPPLPLSPPQQTDHFAQDRNLAPLSPPQTHIFSQDHILTPLSPPQTHAFPQDRILTPLHIPSSQPPRMTAPRLYDPRPPSPELSANLDCAFPPFPGPATSGRRPSTPSNERKTPTSTERAPSRSASRLDRVLTVSPEPFNMEPRSPRLNGGETVLQKMQTLQAGPFNSGRRGSEDPKQASLPSLSRQRSHTPDRNPAISPVESEPTRANTPPPPPPPMPTSPEQAPSAIFTPQLSAEPNALPFGDENWETSHSAERSNTFPLKGDPQDSLREGNMDRTLSKMRSEPGLRSAAADPSPSLIPAYQLPPRKDSVSGTRIDYRNQDAPPVPKAVQQYRQEGIHSPSDSESSMASMTDSTSNSNASSTSLVGSMTSTFDAFLPLSFDAPQYGLEENMAVPALNVKHSMQPGVRAEQPIQRSQSKKFNKVLRNHDTAETTEAVSLTPLESPMDPMLEQIQKRIVPLTLQLHRPPLTRTRTAPGPVPQADSAAWPSVPAAEASQSANMSRRDIGRVPSPTSTTRSRTPERRVGDSQTKNPSVRRPTNARAPCRGCGQVIEGKSVKAADGRLTGRWHRACFVCRTCKEPFTTADFYVINNEPYCEHHYHEKNGSLCHGCNRGIEGQYLETSSSTRYGSVDKKFHPRCFTCSTCRSVLSQDYFEIKGRVFCERHALAAMRAQARQGPGLYPPDRRGLMAERRTTRLINPMMA